MKVIWLNQHASFIRRWRPNRTNEGAGMPILGIKFLIPNDAILEGL